MAGSTCPHRTYRSTRRQRFQSGRVPLLAKAVEGNTLRVQGMRGSFAQPDDLPVPLEKGAGPAALAQCFVLTSRSRLANEPEPRWKLLGSLAEAIPNTGNENARAVTELVSVMRFRQRFLGTGSPDDRFSKMFFGAVATDTAYHRALVDFMLNGLAYWGYWDRFGRDLREAADDPNAFPEGVPHLQFWEDDITRGNPGLPKDFKHDAPYSLRQELATLSHAKSPTIAVWLLSGLTKPADEEIRPLACFLDHPDVRVRRAIVERLAYWNGMADPPEPYSTSNPQTGKTLRWECPGLDTLVAFWKARLKL